MAISAEHKSKFAALHRYWERLHMTEKFSSGTINPKQTKQTNKCVAMHEVQQFDNTCSIANCVIIMHVPAMAAHLNLS